MTDRLREEIVLHELNLHIQEAEHQRWMWRFLTLASIGITIGPAFLFGHGLFSYVWGSVWWLITIVFGAIALRPVDEGAYYLRDRLVDAIAEEQES